MVRGPSPGPAPAAQARASNSRLTRSSWRTWPHRKLRRKVPRVDGALTTQPMALAVLPVRNTSASSMQSPPAGAEATRVTILSPVFARPGASPRSRRCWTSWGRPRCWANVAGRISPALLTKRWSSKAMWMSSGELRGSILRGSIYWVLLVWGCFSVSKTIIPDPQEHFLTHSTRRHTYLVGGLGLKLLMDAVFGPGNFRNEITWKRTSTVKGNFGQGTKFWPRAADVLLFYAKSGKYYFEQQFEAYSQDY